MTIGNPKVADKEIYADNADEVLAYLASVEKNQTIPWQRQLLNISNTKAYEVEKTDVVKGGGIVAQVDGHRVAVGNVALMEKKMFI